MSDLIGICLFFYSFGLIVYEKSCVGAVIFTAILIYYTIRYFRMKTYIEKTIFANKKSLKKQKEFFIDTMTHDFKVPTLAQLRGLELLRNETLGKINPEQRDLITNIENSCKYLLEMIEMFSDACRFEKKMYKLKYETFNISELVLSCFKNLSEKANEKNISLSCNSPDKELIVEADKKELRRVILNLISCAINYSSRNNTINVDIISNGKFFTLNISGMDLMNNKTQDIKNCKYNTIGESLSIYISKKIVELHKGKLSISGNFQNKNNVSLVIPQDKTLFSIR